jgi:hypothetical protein
VAVSRERGIQTLYSDPPVVSLTMRDLSMATTLDEKRKQDRKRAAVYCLKMGIKPRPPAMTPEEKRRRHREGETRRRRELGTKPRVFFVTAEEKHEARRAALAHQFNFARPPSLGEERFERAIEAEDCEPALGRIGLYPVASLDASRLGRAEVDCR